MVEGELSEAFSEVLINNDGDHKKLELLKFIVKNRKKLEGGKAIYVRTYHQTDGNLKKIEIEEEDNVLRLTMGWKTSMGWESKKKAEFEFNIDDLEIVVNSQDIDFFQNSDDGTFIQRFTVSF